MTAIFGAVIICFAGYCYALYDWFTDIRTGLYGREPFEAFYETTALVTYHAYCIRFFNRKQVPK